MFRLDRLDRIVVVVVVVVVVFDLGGRFIVSSCIPFADCIVLEMMIVVSY